MIEIKTPHMDAVVPLSPGTEGPVRKPGSPWYLGHELKKAAIEDINEIVSDFTKVTTEQSKKIAELTNQLEVLTANPKVARDDSRVLRADECMAGWPRPSLR